MVTSRRGPFPDHKLVFFEIKHLVTVRMEKTHYVPSNVENVPPIEPSVVISFSASSPPCNSSLERRSFVIDKMKNVPKVPPNGASVVSQFSASSIQEFSAWWPPSMSHNGPKGPLLRSRLGRNRDLSTLKGSAVQNYDFYLDR